MWLELIEVVLLLVVLLICVRFVELLAVEALLLLSTSIDSIRFFARVRCWVVEKNCALGNNDRWLRPAGVSQNGGVEASASASAEARALKAPTTGVNSGELGVVQSCVNRLSDSDNKIWSSSLFFSFAPSSAFSFPFSPIVGAFSIFSRTLIA